MHARPVLAVIPARLGSERLPRKPLVELAGRPLIEWVWRRVRTFAMADEVVVATDSAEIEAVCASFGALVAMTDAAHASGTERVAEVARMPEYRGYDIIVNVQGDEPFVTEAQVESAVTQVLDGRDIGTIAAPVGTLDAWRDPAVVKVVRRQDGSALYFSRAPIPHLRDTAPDESELGSDRYLRHIGIYAYGRDALERWISLPAEPLERIERLEQLRALAGGMSIGVGIVEASEGGVDTPADAERAGRRLEDLLAQRTTFTLT